jgi:hypothetical protein
MRSSVTRSFLVGKNVELADPLAKAFLAGVRGILAAPLAPGDWVPSSPKNDRKNQAPGAERPATIEGLGVYGRGRWLWVVRSIRSIACEEDEVKEEVKEDEVEMGGCAAELGTRRAGSRLHRFGKDGLFLRGI